jgi:hypothetical protein
MGPDLPHDYRNAPLAAAGRRLWRRGRTLRTDAFRRELRTFATLCAMKVSCERARADSGDGLHARPAEALSCAWFPPGGVRRMILLLELLELLADTAKRDISSEAFYPPPQIPLADGSNRVR